MMPTSEAGNAATPRSSHDLLHIERTRRSHRAGVTSRSSASMPRRMPKRRVLPGAALIASSNSSSSGGSARPQSPRESPGINPALRPAVLQ